MSKPIMTQDEWTALDDGERYRAMAAILGGIDQTPFSLILAYDPVFHGVYRHSLHLFAEFQRIMETGLTAEDAGLDTSAHERTSRDRYRTPTPSAIQATARPPEQWRGPETAGRPVPPGSRSGRPSAFRGW